MKGHTDHYSEKMCEKDFQRLDVLSPPYILSSLHTVVDRVKG